MPFDDPALPVPIAPSADDGIAPAVPTGLAAVPGDSQIFLGWVDNPESDVSHYRIFQASAEAGPYILVDTSLVSGYTVTGLTNGTTYWFKISAVDIFGFESAQTGTVNAAPIFTDPGDVTPPPVPADLSATAGELQIMLDWLDSSAFDFATFKVYRALASGGPFTLIATRTASNYINTGLNAGTTYWYKVSAVDQTGNESAQSSSVNATPTAPPPPPPPAPPTPPFPPPSTSERYLGLYGTEGTGPSRETATTAGTAATSVSAITGASSGDVILLRGGSYGGFTIPNGVTVKPFNGETITVTGAVGMASNTVLAGLTIQVPGASWVMRISSGSNILIRNCNIKGGTTEAVRVDGGNGITFSHCHIDGGLNNHSIKIRDGSSVPTNILLDDCLFTKLFFSSAAEDLVQLENHGLVTIRQCTFRDNPNGEDGLDVKTNSATSQLVLEYCHFIKDNIRAELLLVQGDRPLNDRNHIHHNYFKNGSVSLGAHPEALNDPMWLFEHNVLQVSLYRLRRSFDSETFNNTFMGGTVQLGTSTANDKPQNAVFAGNVYNPVPVFDIRAGSTYTQDW